MPLCLSVCHMSTQIPEYFPLPQSLLKVRSWTVPASLFYANLNRTLPASSGFPMQRNLPLDRIAINVKVFLWGLFGNIQVIILLLLHDFEHRVPLQNKRNVISCHSLFISFPIPGIIKKYLHDCSHIACLLIYFLSDRRIGHEVLGVKSEVMEVSSV